MFPDRNFLLYRTAPSTYQLCPVASLKALVSFHLHSHLPMASLGPFTLYVILG